MARHLLLLFLLLYCLCCTDSPSAEERETANRLTISADGPIGVNLPPDISGRPLILVLGGSLSVARGIDPQEGYAALLEQQLLAQGLPLKILNGGVAEETVEGLLARLRFLLQQPLAVVLLEVGRSDEEQGTRPPAFTSSLDKLIQRIRQPYPEVPIFLLPSSRPGVFRDAFASMENQAGLTVLPILWEEGSSWAPDDRLLHGRLAQSLSEIIAQIVQ